MADLGTYRENLRRFRWTKADADDNGRETYFPPDRLPMSGITLDCRRGGTWAKIDPAKKAKLSKRALRNLLILNFCSLTSTSNSRIATGW